MEFIKQPNIKYYYYFIKVSNINRRHNVLFNCEVTAHIHTNMNQVMYIFSSTISYSPSILEVVQYTH